MHTFFLHVDCIAVNAKAILKYRLLSKHSFNLLNQGEKKSCFFGRNTNLVMMTAYVLWPILQKKTKTKTTKINQPNKTPGKPTNKTNPLKTHKKTQHE